MEMVFTNATWQYIRPESGNPLIHGKLAKYEQLSRYSFDNE